MNSSCEGACDRCAQRTTRTLETPVLRASHHCHELLRSRPGSEGLDPDVLGGRVDRACARTPGSALDLPLREEKGHASARRRAPVLEVAQMPRREDRGGVDARRRAPRQRDDRWMPERRRAATDAVPRAIGVRVRGQVLSGESAAKMRLTRPRERFHEVFTGEHASPKPMAVATATRSRPRSYRCRHTAPGRRLPSTISRRNEPPPATTQP